MDSNTVKPKVPVEVQRPEWTNEYMAEFEPKEEKPFYKLSPSYCRVIVDTVVHNPTMLDGVHPGDPMYVDGERVGVLRTLNISMSMGRHIEATYEIDVYPEGPQLVSEAIYRGTFLNGAVIRNVSYDHYECNRFRAGGLL